MRPPVLVPAAVATALLVALACAAAVVSSHPPGGGLRAPAPAASLAAPAARAPASTAPARGEARLPRPVAVLRAWDARRRAAWAAADAAGLADLYTAGSRAGASDVAMLRAWRARGLRVTGLRPQLLAVDVVEHGPRRLVLRVTERLGRAVALGAGVRRELPASRVGTRRVELRRGVGGWRVGEVVWAGPQARPVATTSRTSRSRKA